MTIDVCSIVADEVANVPSRMKPFIEDRCVDGQHAVDDQDEHLKIFYRLIFALKRIHIQRINHFRQQSRNLLANGNSECCTWFYAPSL